MQAQSSACVMGLAVLEAHGCPCLVVSPSKIVVLANRAARKLFYDVELGVVGQQGDRAEHAVSTSDLPIHFHDTESALHYARLFECLEAYTGCPSSRDRDDESGPCCGDDFWQQQDIEACGPFEVTVLRSPSHAVPAYLEVRHLEVEGVAYYLMTFTKPDTLSTGFTRTASEDLDILNRSGLEKTILRARFREPLSRRSSYDGSRSFTLSDTSQSQLEARFTQLRDAIYFGGELAGFLLSADETFCFPNYHGARYVDPVEIDDVEKFFGNWEFWDEHFSKRLSISDYPAIRLNRERKNVKKVRWGVQKDGSKHVFEGSGECLFDPYTDEYIGCVVWNRDLGEYNELTSRELEGRLGNFETICDTMPHIVWTSSENCGVDYFSQDWYDFTGFTAKTSLGDGWSKAVHPDDLPLIWNNFSEYKKNPEKDFEMEARYLRHDGAYRWMSVRVKPLRDEKTGSFLKCYGTLTDKHDIVMMRTEADHMNKHMINLLAHADVSLFRISTSWKTTMLEGKVSRPFDQSHKDQDVFKSLRSLQVGGVPEFESKLKKTMKSSVTFTTSEDLINGRYIRTRFMQDVDARGTLKGVIGCSIDITELHDRANLQAENARLISEEQMAKESSRLKSQFLAHMSHEIRTPIAGVIGMSDLLAETNVDKEQGDLVDCIHISAQNLLTIVNDILDFSKVEVGQMKLENLPFNLSDLTHELGRVLGHFAQQKSLNFYYANNIPEEVELLGDPGRIRQILLNLLTNAIKFTSQGSITLSVVLTAKEAQMSVKDTGIGMDEDTRMRLFEPFRQGDSSTARLYGGTGLGLVISQNLAQMMGGRIDIESAPKLGTKAIFTMPLSYVRKLELGKLTIGPTREQRQQSAINASDTVVLIVEDNPINQKIALSSVNKLGYKTAAVCNGEEALEYLRAGLPVDVILMDVQMPVLDGYDATRKLRTEKVYEHLKDLPVIALTASAIKGDQEKCREAGMDDYLSKPYPLRMLEEKLSKWSQIRKS